MQNINFLNRQTPNLIKKPVVVGGGGMIETSSVGTLSRSSDMSHLSYPYQNEQLINHQQQQQQQVSQDQEASFGALYLPKKSKTPMFHPKKAVLQRQADAFDVAEKNEQTTDENCYKHFHNDRNENKKFYEDLNDDENEYYDEQDEYCDEYDDESENTNKNMMGQFYGGGKGSSGFSRSSSASAKPGERSECDDEPGGSKEKRLKSELICVVCGASANGYNFDAISCESCKAFFRRNAFRHINLFRCANNNSCEITMATRKKCKKCRIMKCFRVGMRRDWIMTEVEREEKRRKIEENRRRKALSGGGGGGGSGSISGCNFNLADCNSSSPLDASKLAEYSFLNDQSQSNGLDSAQFPIRRRRRRRRHSSIEMDKTNASKQKPASNDLDNKPTAHAQLPLKLAPSSSSSTTTTTTTSEQPSQFDNSNLNPTINNNQLLMSFYKNIAKNEDSEKFANKTQNNIFTSKNPKFGDLSDDANNDEMKRRRRRRKRDNFPDEIPSVFKSDQNAGLNLSGSYPQCSSPSICSTSSESHDSNSSSPLPQQSKQPQPAQTTPTSTTNNSDFQNMSLLQTQQVEAIRQAYSQAIHLVKSQGLPKNIKDINTTINITELAVRRIIFYFKLISDFRNLQHDLMVTLLKNSMMSLLQIHGINSYNKVDHTFKEPNTDDVPFLANSLETVYGPEVYKIAMGVTQSLYDLCDGDLTHIKVLMLIVLFEPANEYLSKEEKALVSELQNKYITLLYAFLRQKFGSPKAELVYKSITFELGKIIELSKWFEKTVAERSNHEFVRPLMKEVFSIPPIDACSNNESISTQSSSKFSSSSSASSSSSCPASASTYESTLNSVDSNYETPGTTSTSVSDSSFVANSNYCEYLSSSPSCANTPSTPLINNFQQHRHNR